MTRTVLAALITALVGGLATAQDVEKNASSTVVKKVVISKDGNTRTYKKVIKDGKVVEESGDRSLIDELDVDDLIRRAKKAGKAGGKSDSKSTSRSRRIVIKDGKKIIDEESGDDLDIEELDVPKSVRDMLEKMKLGKFPGKIDIDIDVDVKGDLPERLREHLESKLDEFGGHLEGLKGLRDFRLEMEGIHGAMPDHVRRMLKDLDVDVPFRGTLHPRRGARKATSERDDLEAELEALRRKMADLRRRIERLER